jgi:pyrroloquinoline-quinone synthase
MPESARVQELLSVVAQYDLNTHPFYEDWRKGTLPESKLKDYAAEYGAFVQTIGSGWDTLDYKEYVAEEAEHVMLWQVFADAFQTRAEATHPQTRALVAVSQSMFQLRPEAVGALFAFEAQQPETAQSKLAGLDEHYVISDKTKEYFRVHARQHSEIDDLKAAIAEMSDDDFKRAKSACTLLAAAMWTGLDGVYYSA